MSEMKDVVLVTIDSLRADRCGFLGSPRGLTPAMDRLAEDGLIFENAIAPAGATGGSVESFFTGSFPIPRPTASDGKQITRQHLKSAVTLPQRFKEMGYQTAAFTTNPWASRFFGYADDFDYFEDFMDDSLTSKSVEAKKRGGKLRDASKQLLNWWQGQHMYMSWDAYYDQILAWLDEARTDDRPFFLWVFLVDVHMPYLPPKQYRSQSIIGSYAANAWLFAGANPDSRFADTLRSRMLTAYDDSVRFTDRFVDAIAREVGEDTVLCVHADHGEAFGERGTYGHGRYYDEVIHVPLFCTNHPKRRITRPMSLRELPELLPAIARGEEVTEDERALVVTSRNQNGWRVAHGGRWRYVTLHGDDWVEDRAGNRIESEPLLELGRRIIADLEEAQRERQRIIGAAAEVAAAL